MTSKQVVVGKMLQCYVVPSVLLDDSSRNQHNFEFFKFSRFVHVIRKIRILRLPDRYISVLRAKTQPRRFLLLASCRFCCHKKTQYLGRFTSKTRG